MVTDAADAAVGVTLRSGPDGKPRTPKGVPEDVAESKEELEVAPEPVPEVVPMRLQWRGA
jgi:hypothetical protein